jgi:hypothetical protein
MQCTQCGAAATPEAVAAGHCSFCGTSFPHAVRAAEKARAVESLLADHDGDGVPDALALLQDAQREIAARTERRATLEKLRAEHAAAAGARLSLGGVAIAAGVVTLVLAFVWMMVVPGTLKADPWFGLHDDLVCPHVCQGCHGPYGFVFYSSTGTSNSSGSLVFCSPPGRSLEGLDGMALWDRKQELAPYSLPGGMWTMYASSLLLWLLPSTGLAWLLASARVRKLRRAEGTLRERLRVLEEQVERDAAQVLREAAGQR